MSECVVCVSKSVVLSILNLNKWLKTWWPGTESNRRHKPFQGSALPTELPGLNQNLKIILPLVKS